MARGVAWQMCFPATALSLAHQGNAQARSACEGDAGSTLGGGSRRGVGTGAGQHCIGGLPFPSPYSRIFDEGLYVESEPCLVDP